VSGRRRGRVGETRLEQRRLRTTQGVFSGAASKISQVVPSTAAGASRRASERIIPEARVPDTS
jgi:hypothetical protein